MSWLKTSEFGDSFQEADWFSADRLQKFQQLNNVEASFTILTFRHKRLRPIETLGELLLRDAGVFAGLNQQFQELPVIPGMD